MYVLQHKDGAFVTPRGSHKSYNRNILKARKYNTREEAEQDRCGNERIVPLANLMQ